jgi:hypothetical protein
VGQGEQVKVSTGSSLLPPMQYMGLKEIVGFCAVETKTNGGQTGGVWQGDAQALAAKETERAEAAAVLERRMAAMEAVLVARRTPISEAKPEAARGPGADLRFQVTAKWNQPDAGVLSHVMPHESVYDIYSI